MPENPHDIQPLQLENVTDYHCHCDFSVDAVGSVEEYCETAVRRNLAEICFTTHYDTNHAVGYGDNFINVKGKHVKATPDNLEQYVDAVRQAAEEFYARGLSVKLGVEFGWYEGCEESLLELTNRYELDYLLCGVHTIDSCCFCTGKSFERNMSRYSMHEYVGRYFRQVINAARSGLFDTIAHLGRYLHHGIAFYGTEIERAHEPHLAEMFAALIETNTSLEINTSPMRYGLKRYYPSIEIVNQAKKAGVAVSYLGSDAHRPEQVGYDFEAAAALVPFAFMHCED
ncbi:MAG: histidinol-phosphatase HisJ family protein [Candidatus Zixiibacteriota bacterium]